MSRVSNPSVALGQIWDKARVVQGKIASGEWWLALLTPRFINHLPDLL